MRIRGAGVPRFFCSKNCYTVGDNCGIIDVTELGGFQAAGAGNLKGMKGFRGNTAQVQMSI